MAFTIAEIAEALGASCAGRTDIEVRSLAEPSGAKADQLALAVVNKFIPSLRESSARAAILPNGTDWQALGLEAAIFVTLGRDSMAHITKALDPGPAIEKGVHPSAIVEPTAKIGEGAAIGALVVIGKGARIGPNARIAAHVSIAEYANIGANALIMSGVKIGAQVVIGDDFIAQPGAVIGSDGMSFQNENQALIENIRKTLGTPEGHEGETIGHWQRIHSLGSVKIGDRIEIGANTAIDRGTIKNTEIGSGTKIDNLVHIGHNVHIGEDCLICGQVGIAGSASVGDRVVLAGQCGIGDNLSIGDDVFAGGSTKIFSNVKSRQVLLGSPAMAMQANIKQQMMLRRLPRFFKKIRALEDRMRGEEAKGA